MPLLPELYNGVFAILYNFAFLLITGDTNFTGANTLKYLSSRRERGSRHKRRDAFIFPHDDFTPLEEIDFINISS